MCRAATIARCCWNCKAAKRPRNIRCVEKTVPSFGRACGYKTCRGARSHPACRTLPYIPSHHSPQGSGRTLCAPTGGIPSQSPPHHSKPVFSLAITFQGHLACPIFTQKTAPYPIKSGVQHRFFLSYSINSIIMLCAFCACSPIRQALSPAQNRSLPSPQSGQTNRPHKQSAGFSGQAGQCPGALSRSSA